MDPVAIIIGLILLGGATLIVTKPFRATTRLAPQEVESGISSEESRKEVLSALRDLDFDFRTGKASEEDYPGLRARLVAEAATYMDAQAHEDDQIEALIRARKTVMAGEQRCPTCGKPLDAGAHFCSHCGAVLGADCPSCHQVVKPGDFFCSSCGKRLELTVDAAA